MYYFDKLHAVCNSYLSMPPRDKEASWQVYCLLIRIFRPLIHGTPNTLRQLVPGPDLYVENKPGACYNETKVNKEAHAREKAHVARRDLGRSKIGRCKNRKGRLEKTIARTRGARRSLDPRESPRTRPRTKWERQKEGGAGRRGGKRESMVASLGPTRV